MPSTVLIEGPFESDYSLSIVNRNLAYGMLDTGCAITLHQRDNIRAYPPSSAFLRMHPRLAAHFQEPAAGARPDIHTRYIYPPYCDSMTGSVRAFHCYGWEESSGGAGSARSLPRARRRRPAGYTHALHLSAVLRQYDRVRSSISLLWMGGVGFSPALCDGLRERARPGDGHRTVLHT